jgi:methyl-accepting chemotaxis protein
MAAAAINTISNESAEVAGKTKEIMAKLVPSIQSSSLLVQEISAASKEQRDAANQINNAIQILNDVSQQNAAAAEEMATNSEELSSQAEQLVSVISHFKIAGHSAQKAKEYNSTRKLITERKTPGFKSNVKNYSKGVDIDLSAPDNLDDEFERF